MFVNLFEIDTYAARAVENKHFSSGTTFDGIFGKGGGEGVDSAGLPHLLAWSSVKLDRQKACILIADDTNSGARFPIASLLDKDGLHGVALVLAKRYILKAVTSIDRSSR